MNTKLIKLGCLSLSIVLLLSAILAFTNAVLSLGWPWWAAIVPLFVYYVLMTSVFIIALILN